MEHRLDRELDKVELYARPYCIYCCRNDGCDCGKFICDNCSCSDRKGRMINGEFTCRDCAGDFRNAACRDCGEPAELVTIDDILLCEECQRDGEHEIDQYLFVPELTTAEQVDAQKHSIDHIDVDTEYTLTWCDNCLTYSVDETECINCGVIHEHGPKYCCAKCNCLVDDFYCPVCEGGDMFVDRSTGEAIEAEQVRFTVKCKFCQKEIEPVIRWGPEWVCRDCRAKNETIPF